MHLTLQSIQKSYGKKTVLQSVSLDVPSGQFVALLGPSGCGKTTLLNLVAGLADLDQGSIRAKDVLWSQKGFTLPPERRRIGMVFQDFALWPHMSVFDNIAFGLKLQKLKAADLRERVRSALEMTQMGAFERAFPHQLSGGQKQRVAIARALAPQPTLMLMDEPLSSLDAKLREQMRWEILSVVKKTGITTIYVTHDQIEALSMADYVVLMNEGRIEQADTPTRLYREPRTIFAATFVGASNLLAGTVLESNGKTVALQIPHQKRPLVGVGECAVGQPASMMVRPGDVRLLPAGSRPSHDGDDNRLSGVILQRAFHGSHWQYRIQIEGVAQPLEAWAAVELPVGEETEVLFAVASCRVVHHSQNAVAV